MKTDPRIWQTDDEQYEVQESFDNKLLYRNSKNGYYYAGSYQSIAEIEDRFGIKLKEV